MSAFAVTSRDSVREQLRGPLTLVLLVGSSQACESATRCSRASPS